ncbi:sensor histidine kinase [Flavisolibacter nicotianae]|uniref:sensor histidine kinase n=1 Tax=Flavisolibacter nicotianae TaxID=2364882 RepID=UPI000EB2A896|nr:histidine kinase [Flavisolibacter nicotianae]
MIKDQLIKRLFIPLMGFCIPLLAGLVRFHSENFLQFALAGCFFTVAVYLAWVGVVRFTGNLRTFPRLKKNILLKLLTLSLVPGLYAAVLCFVFAVVWLRLAGLTFLPGPVIRATLIGGVGGILLSLLYEVVFLSIEKELDNRVLQQIDRERLQAEVTVLKNELDPHFFFNCMNTLSLLVKEDAVKAHKFVHKLSNIYKYFLRNKEVDYVPLREELEFLDNYHFLLRIRFDDTIRIENTIEPQNGATFILPCTLQVLVENAMKHNFFSEKEPLVVSLAMNGAYICVSNPVRPKLHAADSTKVGLRNLKARYRLITNQNVLVHRTASRFLVKLPVVKQTNRYDKSSDH